MITYKNKWSESINKEYLRSSIYREDMKSVWNVIKSVGLGTLRWDIDVIHAQKKTEGSHIFNKERDQAFLPFHRSEFFSITCRVHFAGIGEPAHVDHTVSWVTDVVEVQVANT